MSGTKIIAFEGIDGTGKSVQMEQLRTRLEQRGLTVGVLSFPDYDSFFGGCVGRYLTKKDGVSASDVDQRSMALWFAMDPWSLLKLMSIESVMPSNHLILCLSSVQFSHSVVSYSLRPHESQHARPPCPSSTPRVYSNSCPLSQ